MISHSHCAFRNSPRFVACVLLIGAALAAASCDDSKLLTSPATFASSAVSFDALSTTVVAQPVHNPFCPSVAPFTVPFVVVVRPNGALDLVVTQIRMQFIDSRGVRMPQVTLPAPVPTTQIGSALADARGDLRFALSMGIGCGVGRTGTIEVDLDTRDRRGQQHDSGHLTIDVR
jgi:hypothetical protein